MATGACHDSCGPLFRFATCLRRQNWSRTFGGNVSKEDMVEIDGVISDVLPSAMFRVALDNGHSVLATIAGKMRRFRIRVLTGDRVKVEVSPYDLTRGRITFRHKN